MYLGQQPSGTPADQFSLDTTWADAIDWVLVAFVLILVSVLAVSAIFHRRRIGDSKGAATRPRSLADAEASRLSARVAALVESQKAIGDGAERNAGAPIPANRNTSRTDDAALAALLAKNARANRMMPPSLGEFAESRSDGAGQGVSVTPGGTAAGESTD